MITDNIYGIKITSTAWGRIELATNILWDSLDEAVDNFFSKHEDLEFVMIGRSDHIELRIRRKDNGLVKCRFIPCQKGTTVSEEELAKMLEPLL